MSDTYVISARAVKGGAFIAEPGAARFLKVPSNASRYSPQNAITPTQWTKEVRGLADGDPNPLSISPTGDILVFVHGYNNDIETVLTRTRYLQQDLAAEGWKGAVVAFDWPSDNQILNYYEDRKDGATVASQLVRKCVQIIAAGQDSGCKTNVHLLAHSAGAYVTMEAFVQAEKIGELYKSDWRLGQVAFIAGDVSVESLLPTESWSEPMFRRIMRLTNYSSPYDAALAVSNAKRLGVAPRVGRSGLPVVTNRKAVNVDCGNYFLSLQPKTARYEGDFTHSWYIGDRVFARDLAMTLEGAIDRTAITTRKIIDGRLCLVDANRPANQLEWDIKAPSRRANLS